MSNAPNPSAARHLTVRLLGIVSAGAVAVVYIVAALTTCNADCEAGKTKKLEMQLQNQAACEAKFGIEHCWRDKFLECVKGPTSNSVCAKIIPPGQTAPQ